VAARAALGLARSGADEAALIALETGRAVLLAETFDRRSIDYARVAAVAGPEKADRYLFLTTEITRLETLLLAYHPQAPGRQYDRSQLSADLEVTWAERHALTTSIGGGAMAALSNLEEQPTLAELSAAAGATPVIHLAATGEGGIALILRDGVVSRVELPQLTTGTAAELVATLNEAVASRGVRACDQVCEALWSLAMRSILQQLGETEQAVVIPGGRLSVLPWHAASISERPGTHVLDRLAISYMPNIRSLAAARLAGETMPDQLRVLAIGQPKPTTARLLSTDAEIAAVHARSNNRFRVTRLPATEATAAVVLDSLSGFELLHFAGHAMAVPDNPLASAMIMTHDEHLTVRDLLVRGPGAARFAVLSACETARAEDPLSDEAVNFPSALLQCGLSGVVGSLWTSYDKPSAMIADIFYREWQENGIPPAQALRSAQRWTRDHGFASPLTWANFVYVGP
jgi:CHAT domain-containing protein